MLFLQKKYWRLMLHLQLLLICQKENSYSDQIHLKINYKLNLINRKQHG